MKRVLLDCDGVLADFNSRVIAWANDPRYVRETITTWDILEAWGLEHRQGDLDAFCSTPGFCASLEVIDGAREFVDRLKRAFEVVIVTSPYANVPTWCHERLAWLERHFSIPKRDVIFCKRKDLVRGNALVDDRLSNLAYFPGERVLLDAPWNRDGHDPIEDRILRCATLDEVARFLESELL